MNMTSSLENLVGRYRPSCILIVSPGFMVIVMRDTKNKKKSIKQVQCERDAQPLGALP